MKRYTEKIADPVPVVPLNTARLTILFFYYFFGIEAVRVSLKHLTIENS